MGRSGGWLQGLEQREGWRVYETDDEEPSIASPCGAAAPFRISAIQSGRSVNFLCRYLSTTL